MSKKVYLIIGIILAALGGIVCLSGGYNFMTDLQLALTYGKQMTVVDLVTGPGQLIMGVIALIAGIVLIIIHAMKKGD